MKKLKVLFTGIGSIAGRHIRNLRMLCDEKNISLTINAYRRTYQVYDGVDEIYTKFEDVPDNYDVIFITNPTEMHLETIKLFHEKGRNFFIEKPVVSLGQIQDAMNLSLNKCAVYYIACPLRYNPVIEFVKKNLDPCDIFSVRSISSSYLPEWRPGIDYRKNYSAHKDMGGGVSIDLIHEWDYITYLFGWPLKVKSYIGKKSCLEIDSDDYAIYIAEFEDKIAELHLDYFGRKAIRNIELFTKDDTVVGDIINHSITYLKSEKVIDFNKDKSDYHKKELLHFLKMIDGDEETQEDNFVHGLKILELTQGRRL